MNLEFLRGAEPFLERLFSSLTSSGVSFASYPIDHLCYRVATPTRYAELKDALSQSAKLLDEVLINGRPIATFYLSQPIRFRDRSISLLELPSPKPSKAYAEGFEHAEFVVGNELLKIAPALPKLNWDLSALGGTLNPELRLQLVPDLSAKFHPRSLLEVIQEERLLTLEKMDWRNPSQLVQFHPRGEAILRALRKSELLEKLGDYDPLLAGTFPLGVDTPESDLDILVGGTDLGVLAAKIETACARFPGFKAQQGKSRGNQYVLYQFEYEGFPFEIYGSETESDQQDAYRHLRVEALLLALAGQWAQKEIQALKLKGEKTEPAFAKLFGLAGDPYETLLDLHLGRLDTLRALATKALQTFTRT